jgi:hypothetical protein
LQLSNDKAGAVLSLAIYAKICFALKNFGSEQIAQLTFLFNAKKDNYKAKHINACG